MREYQTLNKLEEKIYEMSDSFSDDENNELMHNFFQEIMARRKEDDVEGGLQAGGVIYHDKAAFKVNEQDGLAPHCHTIETLAQYMDGETMFSSVDSMGQVSKREGDPHNWVTIENYAFEFRIIIGRQSMFVATSTLNDTITIFQLKVIDKFVDYIKLAFEQGLLKYISFNYVTKEKKFVTDMNDMKESDFDELKNLLKTSMEKRRRK